MSNSMDFSSTDVDEFAEVITERFSERLSKIFGKAVFCSCKPFLQICLDKDRGSFITFGADSTYSPKNEEELQLLREYAEHTKISYLIAEGSDPTELRRKHSERMAEESRKAEERAEARLEAEKKRKEDHEFYSLLRMSDRVCR